MDYTLLTAVHARRNTSPKMDARREQAYYDNAADSSQKLDSLVETAVFPLSVARQILALAPDHFKAVALHFNLGAKARKVLS